MRLLVETTTSGSRPSALSHVIDPAVYHDLCLRAHDRGREVVLACSDLTERVAAGERAAREAADRRRRRRDLRRVRKDPEICSANRDFDNRLISAVSRPDVRLDSIGLFVLVQSSTDGGG